MTDRERLATAILDIEKYKNHLAGLGIKAKSDLQSQEKFYAASMLIFSILNRAADIGDLLLDIGSVGVPGKYRDIFALLATQGTISKDLGKKLGDLMYYRNLLAHEYQEFGGDDIYPLIRKLDAVTEFLEVVKKKMRR